MTLADASTAPSEQRRRRLWPLAFALLGIANLATGAFVAFRQPIRAHDFWQIYDWCSKWLYSGVSLYGSDLQIDYPPNAIVTYAPLAAVPASRVLALWAVTTLALTPILPFAVMRSVGPRPRARAWMLPTVLFICWGGVRSILQFSQLSFLLAFVAVLMRVHWIVGGAALGLALAKPHVAGPIALYLACRRRVGTTLIAAVVVLTEYWMFCRHAGVTLLQPIVGWMASLRANYAGHGALDGYTSLRPWVLAAIGDQTTSDVVWIACGLATLIVLCVAAVRDRTDTLAVPGLLCLWSLLMIYHNLNNLILILPAFIFLLTVDDPDTRAWRWTTIGVLQAALMLDIPVRFRSLAGGPLARVVIDADRLLVLGTFGVVVWCWWRLQRA